jgi:thioredoxin
MAIKKQFSSFEEMLEQAPCPVLVDFYATWCGPCQIMAPILEQVSTHLGDRLQVVKIDSDKYPHLASKYQVQAFPSLILFKNGQPVERIEGVQPLPQLLQLLQPLL